MRNTSGPRGSNTRGHRSLRRSVHPLDRPALSNDAKFATVSALSLPVVNDARRPGSIPSSHQRSGDDGGPAEQDISSCARPAQRADKHEYSLLGSTARPGDHTRQICKIAADVRQNAFDQSAHNPVVGYSETTRRMASVLKFGDGRTFVESLPTLTDELVSATALSVRDPGILPSIIAARDMWVGKKSTVEMNSLGVTLAHLADAGVTLNQCFDDEGWSMYDLMNIDPTWDVLKQMGIQTSTFQNRVDKIPLALITEKPISLTFQMFFDIVSIDDAVNRLAFKTGDFRLLGATAADLIDHGLVESLASEMANRESMDMFVNNLSATTAQMEFLFPKQTNIGLTMQTHTPDSGVSRIQYRAHQLR